MSKDAILEAAYEHAPWMYWVGTFTAFLTAFYVFRALFMAFFGEYRGDIGKEDAHHSHGHDENGHAGIHESPPVMWIPLAILAALSLVGGFINIPKFLEPIFASAEGGVPDWVGMCSLDRRIRRHRARLLVLCAGARPSRTRSARRFSRCMTLIYNKYFVDELYDATVVEPLVDGSRTLLWRTADAGAIDGTVNGIGKVARSIGGALKLLQSGLHPQLCGLGGGRVHRHRDRDGAVTGAFDDAPRRRPLSPARRLFWSCWSLPRTTMARAGALVISLVIFVVSLGLHRAVLVRQSLRLRVFDQRLLDRLPAHPLSRRPGRLEPVAGAADHAAHAHRGAGVMEVHRPSRQRIFRVPDPARIRADRRIRFDRPVPVLRVLGSLSGPDVFPHRHLGPRPAHLRDRQVLPVHLRRIRADAGRHHLSVQPEPARSTISRSSARFRPGS